MKVGDRRTAEREMDVCMVKNEESPTLNSNPKLGRIGGRSYPRGSLQAERANKTVNDGAQKIREGIPKPAP